MTGANEIRQEILDLRRSSPARGTALLPALYVAQRRLGWLSEEALTVVAETLGLPKAEVKGVASFYAMLRRKPVGRHVIHLCTNVVCMIMGAERLIDILKARYGLEPNGTSPDGRFSLVIMECIGACGTGPAMLVDSDFHHSLTEERFMEILDGYQ